MVKAIREVVKDLGEGGEVRGQEVGYGGVLGAEQESSRRCLRSERGTWRVLCYGGVRRG